MASEEDKVKAVVKLGGCLLGTVVCAGATSHYGFEDKPDGMGIIAVLWMGIVGGALGSDSPVLAAMGAVSLLTVWAIKRCSRC